VGGNVLQVLNDKQLHKHDRIQRGATNRAIKGRCQGPHKTKVDALEHLQVEVVRRHELDQRRADKMEA
jgi:hypothetical protein